jgi:hypothetical protein
MTILLHYSTVLAMLLRPVALWTEYVIVALQVSMACMLEGYQPRLCSSVSAILWLWLLYSSKHIPTVVLSGRTVWTKVAWLVQISYLDKP